MTVSPSIVNDLDHNKGWTLSDIEQYVDALSFLGIDPEKPLKALQETLDYPTRNFGFFDEKSPQFSELAKYLKYEKNLVSDDSCSYLWIDDHYQMVSRLHVQNLIHRLTMDQAKPNQIECFYKMALVESFKPLAEMRNPNGLINVNNGVLDLKTRKLEKPDPSRFFKYKIKHNFVPAAKCPTFLRFLDFVFLGNKDLIRLTAQIFGYTLLGGDPFAHKAFLLYGEGRNGKSTYLFVLQNLLGLSNVSSVSMKMLGKPFSMIRLDGKLANIVEESPAEIDQEEFKNVVSGGHVTAAMKHKPEFDLKVDARLFFATNKIPRFNDTSIGNRERLCIIPFSRYIKPEERDVGIFNKLQSEMPGILNFALDGLEDFLQTKKFLKVKVVEDMLEQYMTETDSVFDWCEQHLLLDPDCSEKIKVSHLFKIYKIDAPDTGQKPVGYIEFSRRLNGWLKHKVGVDAADEFRSRESSKRSLKKVRCSHPRFNEIKLTSNGAPY